MPILITVFPGVLDAFFYLKIGLQIPPASYTVQVGGKMIKFARWKHSVTPLTLAMGGKQQ